MFLSSSLVVLVLSPIALSLNIQRRDNATILDSRATAAAGWPTSLDPSHEKGVFGVEGGWKDSYLKEESGVPVIYGNYPKGSYAGSTNPGIAGFIFEADGNVGITTAKKATLKYQVQFQSGFNFALAGKLPGMYGGDYRSIAKTCAGGNHDDQCWSARLMWRTNGKGELYAYLPTANENLPICSQYDCDAKYGTSIGTGSWSFTPGQWYQIEQRVVLNDFGKSNGEIQVLVGGVSKIHITGVVLRTSDEGRIQGVMMHTFFGGSSTPDYQSPKDQHALFKDFHLDVTQTF